MYKENYLFLTKKRIIYSFPSSKFLRSVLKTKIYPRAYSRKLKVWYSDLTYITAVQALRVIEKHNFTCSEEDKKILNTYAKNVSFNNTALKLNGFKGKLLSYQPQGIDFLLSNNKCIQGDDMGMGKTLQVIVAIKEANLFPCIIVCPAFLKYNWADEFNKWYDANDISIIDTNNQDFSRSITIINYRILDKYKETLLSKKYALCVFDESQYIKNPKSQRSKVSIEMANRSPRAFLLSATPILNRTSELIGQFEALGVLNDFGGWHGFSKRYCDLKITKYGMDTSSSSHVEELYQIMINNFYLKRLKRDYLKDLPEKISSKLEVDIRNFKEYESEYEEIIKIIHDSTYTQQLKLLATLRRLTGIGKIPYAKEWVKNTIAQGNKVIVFCVHREVVQELGKLLNCPIIYGGVSAKKKNTIKDEFQEGKHDCIVCNIDSGGVGLNLTAGNFVLMLEEDYSPAKNEQAEDRSWRYGQTRQVNVVKVLAKNTVDEYIHEVVNKKIKPTDTINKGIGINDKKVSENVVSEVIRMIINDGQ